MRKFCLVMVVVTALVVAGSSNKAFSADVTGGVSVVSPYWQSDANSVYTFIAVSVPSVAAGISRHVTVAAVTGDSRADVSAAVTVDKGKTGRFFIANTNHSSVNSNTVSGANWIGITGSGHVVITTVGMVSLDSSATGLPIGADGVSVWGAVVVPGGTGFAMEFIGDMRDSVVGSFPAALRQNAGSGLAL